MDLVAARKIATTLIKKHGLIETGWKFEFDNAKKRLGLCTFSTKTISISRYMVAAATEAQVRQAILHEVAHAMLPYEAKHGYLWTAKCREIGYTGKRTAYNPYVDNQLAKTNAAYGGNTVFLTTLIREKDTIVTRSGKTGVIVKVARTRYHFKVADGKIWATAFSAVKKIAEGTVSMSSEIVDREVISYPVTRASTSPVTSTHFFVKGSLVKTISNRSKWGNCLGVVQSVGPKNYLLKLESGQLLRASHSMVTSR